jgi:TetR/AcrR family transcriptional regulator, lmrAB and yxaGH operons repressor
MRVRDRLTSATTALMQRHGVAGTGIAEILDTSGVTRRSIYLNFPGGKAELVAAATRAAGDQMTQALSDQIQKSDPIAAIARFCRDALTATDFDGGCPIVAAAYSRADAPEAASIAADVFAGWRDMLVERLMRDGITRRRAESLAATIVAAFEGAVMLCRAAQSTEPLDHVARDLKWLVAQHRPASPRPRRSAR